MGAFYAWGLDFWRAFLERPKLFRWICKLFMGRYAWNELVGLKQAVEKGYTNDGMWSFDPFDQNIGYYLEEMDYHKEFDNYKDW